MFKARLLLFLITLIPFLVNGQNVYLDSLKVELANTRDDTIKVKILNAISNSIYSSSPDEAIAYGTQAKELAEQINDSTGMAYALKNIGLGHYIYFNHVEVSINWEQSLAIFEALNDDLGSANLLSNLGVIYSAQGDDAKAIDYYLRSLRLSEKLGDSLRIASALGNVGHVYSSKKATRAKALGYFMDALKIGENIKDLYIIGSTTSNIGDIYYQNEAYDVALFYLEKSLIAFENTVDAGFTLNLMGNVYAAKGNFCFGS